MKPKTYLIIGIALIVGAFLIRLYTSAVLDKQEDELVQEYLGVCENPEDLVTFDGLTVKVTPMARPATGLYSIGWNYSGTLEDELESSTVHKTFEHTYSEEGQYVLFVGFMALSPEDLEDMDGTSHITGEEAPISGGTGEFSLCAVDLAFSI